MRNPANMSFYKEMTASFMHHMSLPLKFSTNFTGRIDKFVKLKGPSGNVWQVGVMKRAGKFVLRFEWKEFVIANDIKKNDLLIFKYNGNSSFEVQIFKPNGCQRISSFFAKKESTNLQEVDVGRNKCQHEIIISESSSESENQIEQTPTRDEKLTWHPKKNVVTSKNQNDANYREIAKKEYPFMYSARNLHLTNTQNMKALSLAREVQPGNPYFVGIIRPSCIGFGCHFVLSVPAKFSATHLQRRTQKTLLYYKGRKWEAMYIFKNNRTMIGSTGWKSFVIENNLQNGDNYLFELLKDQNEIISFRVHLTKK